MTEIRDVLKTAFINFDLSATEKKRRSVNWRAPL